LKSVSESVQLSTTMLSRFLKVFDVSEKARELMKSRQIDSVTIIHTLAMFPYEEQNTIIDYIVNKEFDTQSIRGLKELRDGLPNEDIEVLIKRMIDSRNVKVSVIKFDKQDLMISIDILSEKLNTIVGQENLRECYLNGISGYIKLSKKGENLLRQYAKNNKITFQNLIHKLLS
jgi:hypothetical protein